MAIDARRRCERWPACTPPINRSSSPTRRFIKSSVFRNVSEFRRSMERSNRAGLLGYPREIDPRSPQPLSTRSVSLPNDWDRGAWDNAPGIPPGQLPAAIRIAQGLYTSRVVISIFDSHEPKSPSLLGWHEPPRWAGGHGRPISPSPAVIGQMDGQHRRDLGPDSGGEQRQCHGQQSG